MSTDTLTALSSQPPSTRALHSSVYLATAAVCLAALCISSGLLSSDTLSVRVTLCIALLLFSAFALLSRLQAPQNPTPHTTAPLTQHLQHASLPILILSATHVLITALGPTAQPLHPTLYILSAFFVASLPTRAALSTALVAVLFELFPIFHADHATQPLVHASFTAAFTGLSALYLQTRPLDDEPHHPTPTTPLPPTPFQPEDPTQTRAALQSLEAHTHHNLSLLQRALSCHTVALYRVDPSNTSIFHLTRACGPTHAISTTIHARTGALASITRRKEPLRTQSLSPDRPTLSYYTHTTPPSPVRSLLALPILENDTVTYALFLDRLERSPFTEDDLALALATAQHLNHAASTEHLFLSMTRARQELDRLYTASRLLNKTLTPEEVHTVALDCLETIVPYDFAAFVHTESSWGHMHHTVARCHIPTDAHTHLQPHEAQTLEHCKRTLEGLSFDHNNGLVSMSIEMAQYLPYTGDYDPSHNLLFTRDTPLPPIRSLLILPLIAQNEPIGALVIACTRTNAFPQARRELLEVFGNQLAISTQNAHSYASMRTMATTDGLTGLNNHRTFKLRLNEVIARSQRTNSPFCTILTDIDHFKSVNDTHGHPVGDEVLRRVSETIRNTLRQTDIPARYGGEEFGIILENTDLAGAQHIAERLRSAVERLSFTSEQGRFSVTMSFGIGQFPLDAEDQAALIDRTDKALYWSKSHGRNQVTVFDHIPNT